MAKYVSTGKIHFLRTIGALAFGIVFALLIGLIYGWAMDLIPFIIVQVIVFAGAIGLVAVISIPMVHIGLIRNKAVKVLCVLITCLVTWYAQWVYFTQPTFWTSLFEYKHVVRDILAWSDTREIVFSRGFSGNGPGISGIGIVIIDAIEFLCFLFPLFFALKFSNDYFCESCRNFCPEKVSYVRDLDENKIPSAEETGDFRFIAPLHSTKTTQPPPGPSWEINFAHCDKCNQFGIINIRRGTVSMDKKNKPVFGNGACIARHTLVSQASVSELSEMKRS